MSSVICQVVMDGVVAVLLLGVVDLGGAGEGRGCESRVKGQGSRMEGGWRGAEAGVEGGGCMMGLTLGHGPGPSLHTLDGHWGSGGRGGA